MLQRVHRVALPEGSLVIAHSCQGHLPTYTGWYASPVGVAEPFKYTRLAVFSD